MRRQNVLANKSRAVGVWRMSVADLCYCGDDLPRQPCASDVVVSCDVVCDQPKERNECVEPSACLGLGRYKTAWTLLHKLRRAMVRPDRDRLRGRVEVDEAYWGGEEEGVIGRQTHAKALIVVAAAEDGGGVGRIRLRHITTADREQLHGFIQDSIEPGGTVCTDGLPAYLGLTNYVHDRKVQRRQAKGVHLLPRVHRVISLLKRWLLGTHQGAVGHDYLDDDLDEFTFRFNRRTSKSRGKLFYRLTQQAVQIAPVTFQAITKPQSLGVGGVK